MMELAFDSETLRAICESDAQAKRALGSDIAEILKHRLADMQAATSISDLVAGKPRLLQSSEIGQECMVVDLRDGCRVVFRANHARRNPMTEAGKIDWPKVSRIKILRIEREHV